MSHKRKYAKLFLTLCTCTALSACASQAPTASKAVYTSNAPQDVIERAAQYAYTPTKSVNYLERAYKKKPDNESFATDYAIALRNHNKLTIADTVLAPFANEKTASSRASSEYAAIKLAQGEYSQAEKFAQNAILADDVNFKAYHRLGIALDAQTLHEEAERAYRKGLEIWQGDPTTIMNNLALNLATQGYLTESVEILRRAQGVSPDRLEVERNLRIVTALLQSEGIPVPKPQTKPEYVAHDPAALSADDAQEPAAEPPAAIETPEKITE